MKTLLTTKAAHNQMIYLVYVLLLGIKNTITPIIVSMIYVVQQSAVSISLK